MKLLLIFPPAPAESFHEIISKFDYMELEGELIKETSRYGMTNDYERRKEFENSVKKAANKIDDLKGLLSGLGDKMVVQMIEEVERQFRMKEEANNTSLGFFYHGLILPMVLVLQGNVTRFPTIKGTLFNFEFAESKYNMVIKGGYSGA